MAGSSPAMTPRFSVLTGLDAVIFCREGDGRIKFGHDHSPAGSCEPPGEGGGSAVALGKSNEKAERTALHRRFLALREFSPLKAPDVCSGQLQLQAPPLPIVIWREPVHASFTGRVRMRY